MPKCVHAMKTNCRHNVPLRRGMDRQLVATTPRADTTGSRALSSAWRQARDEKVIAREDGYTYIAALRSPDLRHTTKREGDTSVTVVTSNVSVSQCAGEMLKRKGLPNRRCREKIKIRAGSRAGDPNQIKSNKDMRYLSGVWCAYRASLCGVGSYRQAGIGR